MEEGLKCCISNNWLSVTLETDSLMVYNFSNGSWEIPWSISMKIKHINDMRSCMNIGVQHIMRKGNKVTYYFTNIIFSFAGIKRIEYQSLQQVLKQGRSLLAIDL